MNIEAKPIDHKDVETIKQWIRTGHYLKKWPTAVQQIIGIYADGKLVGTTIYGIGTRPHSTREIFQNDDGSPIMQNNQMWDLQRLFLEPKAQKSIKNLASMSIGRSNEWIRKHAKTKDGLPVLAIQSFADGAVGHEGAVYKATNALYLGKQRSGKHKFIYPLGKKQKHRDRLISKIRKPILDYPKSNTSDIERHLKQRGVDPVEKDKKSIQGMLDKQILNPETNNKILVKTALSYDKNHPSYKMAKQLIKRAMS